MKRYIAILNQNGQTAPVATVLENSLGGELVWTRGSAGQYVGTLAGGFPLTKTTALCGKGQGGESDTSTSLDLSPTSADFISLTTQDVRGDGQYVHSDGLLVRTTVSIRVYE